MTPKPWYAAVTTTYDGEHFTVYIGRKRKHAARAAEHAWNDCRYGHVAVLAGGSNRPYAVPVIAPLVCNSGYKPVGVGQLAAEGGLSDSWIKWMVVEVWARQRPT